MKKYFKYLLESQSLFVHTSIVIYLISLIVLSLTLQPVYNTFVEKMRFAQLYRENANFPIVWFINSVSAEEKIKAIQILNENEKYEYLIKEIERSDDLSINYIINTNLANKLYYLEMKDDDIGIILPSSIANQMKLTIGDDYRYIFTKYDIEETIIYPLIKMNDSQERLKIEKANVLSDEMNYQNVIVIVDNQKAMQYALNSLDHGFYDQSQNKFSKEDLINETGIDGDYLGLEIFTITSQTKRYEIPIKNYLINDIFLFISLFVIILFSQYYLLKLKLKRFGKDYAVFQVLGSSSKEMLSYLSFEEILKLGVAIIYYLIIYMFGIFGKIDFVFVLINIILLLVSSTLLMYICTRILKIEKYLDQIKQIES